MIERQTEFSGDGGVTIAATLALPDGERRDGERRDGFPALLLVQGSGPTDRDGNQPPAHMTNLEKQIAAALARQGVASLRYDKRGMYANAASMPREAAGATDFFRWEAQVGDAAQGFGFLAQQPQIDARRAGVFGHSEGGLIALELAAGARRVAPAALVLASTPGRALGPVLNDQLDRLMIRQGAPAATRREILAKNDEIVAHIVATGEIPTDVPPGLKALYQPYLRHFLQSLFRLDPLALARRAQAPVLALNGDRDPQVLADLDAVPLAAALAGRTHATTTLRIVAGASHTLKPTASMDENAHAGDIAPAALQALALWLEEIGWAR